MKTSIIIAAISALMIISSIIGKYILLKIWMKVEHPWRVNVWLDFLWKIGMPVYIGSVAVIIFISIMGK